MPKLHSSFQVSPQTLAQWLTEPGKKVLDPTPQQAAVIGAPLEPMLVMAGAGAGKTETMAARVVWLVVNRMVRPDQVLGLTFTRKAAQELGRRIRQRLGYLAGAEQMRDVDPGGELRAAMAAASPTVLTYDAYAAQIIKEYGLLIPVEPAGRIITQAELFGIAFEVVSNYRGNISSKNQPATVASNLIALATNMGDAVMDEEEVIAEATAFIKEMESLPGARGADVYTNDQAKWMAAQRERMDYLPLLRELQAELNRRGVTTFNQQMALAARLAARNQHVQQAQRERYRVIMLDEYQDTSAAQRVLLSSLFGGVQPGLGVSAVGDPMQAIYGWRGATSENLRAFPEDFPTAQGPAPVRQLSTSWRNPAKVLDMANLVGDAVLGGGSARPVQRLDPRPGAPAGQVALGYFNSAEEELSFVADELAQEYSRWQQQGSERGEAFSAAVLVRKNAQAGPIAAALEERGVPWEIAGLGGLLALPEVQDLVALATCLIRPNDAAAALRVLCGPMVGLGVSDLVALKKRARSLGMSAQAAVSSPHVEELISQGTPGTQGTVAEQNPALENLKAQLAALAQTPPDHVVGLIDAVADLGERAAYSPEGGARLERLSATLRRLRTHSLRKSLSDLFADIELAFGLRTEVLARSTTGAGAIHLDAFHDVVASYPAENLASLLEYLALAREHEQGLAQGEQAAKPNVVQIMTAHKAKGLEFDIVAVINADAATYSSTAETYLTQAKRVPGGQGFELDTTDAESRSDIAKAVKEYLEQVRHSLREEAARLFYVAITRTQQRLMVTAHDRGGRKPAPYEHLASLMATYKELVVEQATSAEVAEEKESEGNDVLDVPPAQFPALKPHPQALAGQERVLAALKQLPELSAGETFNFWEAETSALIEEYAALSAPEVEVELPGELTASDLVAIKSDPVAYASRQRRPVPFKPNAYAKRGTAFHLWLEERFAGAGFLEPEQLPGMEETEGTPEEFHALKEAFLASEWEERTPVYVEYPFEIAIGQSIVRGRMDAVFRDPDDPAGWLIIDWKTGRAPQGPERAAAIIQLAVYREAFLRTVGEHAPVRAAFYYVAQSHLFEPEKLPGTLQLAQLLADASAPRT